MIFDDATTFCEHLYRCNSLEACGDLFRKTIRPTGFDTFACGEVDLVNRERTVIYVLNWPDRWKRFYLASGLVNRDPIIEELNRRKQPFLWSELRNDRRIGLAGREALQLFQAHGWSEGLAVPLHRNDSQFGLVSLVGQDARPDRATRDALVMMSIVLYEKARRLSSRIGIPLQIAGLTLRELDAMRLVARGNTDREIGKLLKISADTAHEYVESAKRKLKARSRSEAVAVAVSLGLV
ncbi:MAG: autoinducer binding domain-containing protein [Bradyrhizobium sp.]|nr:autoinducer binding domain-containing protein [Bradyrhizobium sp.]